MSKGPVKNAIRSEWAQRLPDLNVRIRARRAQLGVTGAELAERVGISASYVSLIESGAKVPDEDVAARLARVLGDDEDLYRGWTRAARLGLDKLDLLNRLEAIARTPAYVSLVESGQALPRIDSEPARIHQQEEAEALRVRLHEVASRLSTRPDPGPAPTSRASSTLESDPSDVTIVRVPVLPHGTEPARLDTRSPSPPVRDHLSIDRRLVDARDGRAFAYEVTADAMKHLRGLAAPGDFVVLRPGGALAADRICAVRTARGIVLSRVLLKERVLLLLPGEGELEFESVDVPDAKALQSAIAGTHALLIRR